MPPKRMTANPIKPARHRPGKGPQEESSSESESEDQEEVQENQVGPSKSAAESTKIASNLRNVDLNERRANAAASEAARLEAEIAARAAAEEGFETESSGEEESGSEEEGSSSEESSSEDEAPRTLLRPTFVRKDNRGSTGTAARDASKTDEEKFAEEEARKKQKANELVQEQVERNAAARAAGKKNWDDDEEVNEDDIDDTDGLDPEAEYAGWKLRELKRVKREREAIEVAEKEREEIERRRNLTVEEREAEDKEFIQKQKEEQEGKGKIGYMQKYFHKGAFFQDDAKELGLDQRDIMGARFVEQINRETLPEFMQIRDMTKLGKKGRTRYKDLKSEDTGRWGDYAPKRKKDDMNLDERFQPDKQGGGKEGPSGANATAVQERRRAPEGAPEGPRRERRRDQSGDRGDSYKPSKDTYDRDRRRRSYSRSRSRSPIRRNRSSRKRDSESPQRRKRSPSPSSRRGDERNDKRRRVDVR